MKKFRIACLLALSLCLFGCGAGTDASTQTGSSAPVNVEGSVAGDNTEQREVVVLDDFSSVSDNNTVSEDTVVVATPVEDIPEGMYRSELTNMWIDESLRDLRPIAVMVDNDSRALPHYGINDADVVYEMMNSTENNRITRLMVIMKDWKSISQLGSVRSVRPTNFMLAAEYNAIIIHDGGPVYIDEYIAKPYVNHLSGGFARMSNGKPTEFTEYVTYDDYYNSSKGQSYNGLQKRIDAAGFSESYNSYYPGSHFKFYDNDTELSGSGVVAASKVSIPFPNNQSKLIYNDTSKTYDYYEHGGYHVDAGNNNEVTTFKNAIVYSCPFSPCEQYGVVDQHGYMVYHVVNNGEGWYFTDGQAVPITWSKSGETSLTVFKNKNTGEEITLNTGKTYIAVVPSDVWSQLVIQ